MNIASLAPRAVIRSLIGGFLLLMSLGERASAQAPGVIESHPRPYAGNPNFVTPEPESRPGGGEYVQPRQDVKSKLLDSAAQIVRVAARPTPAPAAQPAQEATTEPSATPAPFASPLADYRPRRFWVEADYLLWWMRGDSLPALVTTSPPGTPQNQAGVLGVPGTTVLFGNSTESGQLLSGGSITLGYWLNCDQTCGIEANFFMLSSQANNFSAATNGQTILARPFFDVTTGQQNSQLIPSGRIGVSDTSSLLGAGAWGTHCLCANPCACNPYRLDWLLGFRYLRLTDDLSIGENLTSTAANNGIPVGTNFAVSDQFSTQNNFYGVDLGLRGEIQRGRWVFSSFAHVALGVTCSEVDINGSTRVTVPGGTPVVNQGGLLALQSNIGHFNHTQFAVVPEIGAKLGYQLTPNLRLQVGYDFLFWSNVARPGNQIDTSINPNLLPPVVAPVTGPLHPAANFQGTSFWAQGISLGVFFRF